MSSFDPNSFGAPTNGRGRDSYDDYGSGQSRSSESRIRKVPLVMSIIFGVVAAVCAVISFTLSGTELTADQEALRSFALLGGLISFIGLIIVGRKVVRQR